MNAIAERLNLALPLPQARYGLDAWLCGAVVVLLMSDYDGAAALELIALLSTVHLVIAPSVPSGVAIASWLTNLLDGLGLTTTNIFAERAFIDDVRQLALDDEILVRDVAELNPSRRQPTHW